MLSIDGKPLQHIIDWFGIATPVTVTGLPALSVPCGWTDDGLPVGLQLIARPYAEADLLLCAYRLQEEPGFRHRWPAVERSTDDGGSGAEIALDVVRLARQADAKLPTIGSSLLASSRPSAFAARSRSTAPSTWPQGVRSTKHRPPSTTSRPPIITLSTAPPCSSRTKAPRIVERM